MADSANPPHFAPVTLEGRWVRLEPLTTAHVDALSAAASDPTIWTWYVLAFDTPDKMQRLMAQAQRAQADGSELPFVQIERRSGQVVGSTRYMNIDRANRRAEIGFTWLISRCQRSGINTEAKYLLLRHAFETLGLNRVEFKTDVLNEKSRRALERIGAVQEGIFRSHMVTEIGRIRDSIYYSIIKTEWPAVKSRLETFLSR